MVDAGGYSFFLSGLAMLQDLIQLSSSFDGPMVALKHLKIEGSLPGGKTDFMPLLKHVKEVLGENRIIVQADVESSRQLLSQVNTLSHKNGFSKLVFLKAANMGMVSEHYHYIFTNPDVSTLDLEPYKFSGCNITALRIVDFDSPRTKALITGLRIALRRANSKSFLPSIGIQVGSTPLHKFPF